MTTATLPAFGELAMGREATTMALALLVDRIRNLDGEDKKDFFDLVRGLHRVDSDEEINSIVTAIREVLEPRKGKTVSVTLPPVDSRASNKGLDQWMSFIGAKIREHRKAAKITQAELASRCGLPQSHISRLEGGKHSPSHLTVEKIAAALGVPAASLDPSA